MSASADAVAVAQESYRAAVRAAGETLHRAERLYAEASAEIDGYVHASVMASRQHGVRCPIAATQTKEVAGEPSRRATAGAAKHRSRRSRSPLPFQPTGQAA